MSMSTTLNLKRTTFDVSGHSYADAEHIEAGDLWGTVLLTEWTRPVDGGWSHDIVSSVSLFLDEKEIREIHALLTKHIADFDEAYAKVETETLAF